MTELEQQSYYALEKPTPWPNANKQLLGLGVGLPVNPMDRLANFSADEFERFTLEWADGYLRKHVSGIEEIQQRGGSGDKGRDIVVWLDPPSDKPRRWHLYQCKRYSQALGPGPAASEIAKVLFYSHRGDYALPEEYWFVTRKGVTGTLQDKLDDPDTLNTFILDNWSQHCATAITKKGAPLTPDLRAYIEGLDLGFIRAKQPLEFLNEHAQTGYHRFVFGGPLHERPPKKPPSTVTLSEQRYVAQLYEVIGEMVGTRVTDTADFDANARCSRLFKRSRISFYSAEALKELARDHMDDIGYFDQIMKEFEDGLYFTHSEPASSGYERLAATVTAAQQQQVSEGHALAPYIVSADREGICHHLANSDLITWCGHD